MTNLMQEVNGFTDEQNLEERGKISRFRPGRINGNKERLLGQGAYLAGLIHGDERGDHRLPERVLVVPQPVRLHVGVGRDEELDTRREVLFTRLRLIEFARRNAITGRLRLIWSLM